MTPWWTSHAAGWIGAVVGTTNGLLGGVIGTVAGVYGPRGRAKGLVYGLVALVLAGGILALAAGLLALAERQPYVVWYPLVLVGAMDTLLMCVLAPVIRRAYRQADARRLEAEELRRT